MRKMVSIELQERNGWTWHDIPVEIAKEIVRDMAKQIGNDDLGWFCLGLTVHELDDLAEVVRVETQSRERAQNLAQSARVGLLGEI